ncbi:MAG: hypothetical protein A2Y17_07390 [Clostridiales bacterium GWF2_38_85]|nr:MAG: hypothetical protein A2Y17_07390 [Clostridiales bacterium GWF2_38_85]HBL84304.1 hypothetical protein [Clostridiales bacterium]
MNKISSMTKKFKCKSEKYIFFSAVLFLPIKIIPYFNIINRTLRLSIVAVAFIMLILGIINSNRKQKSSISLFIFISMIFSIMNYYGQWTDLISLSDKLYAFALFWFPLWLAVYYLQEEASWSKKTVFKYLLILQTFIVITTIIGLIEYPKAARDLASYVNTLVIYYIKNIGGYDFIYGSVLFIPCLLYYSRFVKYKIIIYFIILLNIICIVMSQYTLALILLILAVIYMFLKKYCKNTTSLIIAYIGAFIIMLISIAPKSFFYSVADTFYKYSLNAVGDKIIDFYTSISRGEFFGTIGDRIDLYTNSLKAFTNHPLTGSVFFNNTVLGGHAELLDILGACGLLGFILFIYLMRKYYTLLKNTQSNPHYYIYAKTVFWFFILLGCVDTLFNSPAIAVNAFLIPALLSMDYQNRDYT